MKASELIEKLTQHVYVYGDQEVAILDGEGYSYPAFVEAEPRPRTIQESEMQFTIY